MKVDFNQRKGVHANLTKVGKREREGVNFDQKIGGRQLRVVPKRKT